MGNPLKNAVLKPPPESELQQAIRFTCDELMRVKTCFEMESDPELIEAYIYEQKALAARYRYLLKIAKEQGHTATFCPPFSGRNAG